MQFARVLVCIACLAAVLPGSGAAGAASSGSDPEPQLIPLVGEVLAPPHVVPGSGGRRHLVYEIRLANVTNGRASFKRITVIDNGSGRSIATLDANAIGGRLSLGGRRGDEANDLGPFQFGVVFVHVVLESDAPVPTSLAHDIDGSFKEFNADLTMRIAETAVVTRVPPVLGAPLRGRGFVAADGCCDSTRHVRALLPVNGAFRLSQRFAIDWEQIDEENRVFRSDSKDPRSYHIYGAPILAVADGTVVHARDDLPDQVPGALPQGLPISEADGNFAILDIGNGAYVLYAHMQPGSVKVRAGDRVQRGDPIGNVGNSGNSQAPHLHLQVMDGASGFLSNGIPYVFDAFSITAVDEAGTADFDRAEASGTPLTLTPRSPPAQLEKVLPLDLSVVDWRN
jgi:hypothetical protein